MIVRTWPQPEAPSQLLSESGGLTLPGPRGALASAWCQISESRSGESDLRDRASESGPGVTVNLNVTWRRLLAGTLYLFKLRVSAASVAPDS